MARPKKKDPCPFDPTQERGGPSCKYGERCPYFLRRGKRVVCFGGVPTDMTLGHVLAANVLIED